MSMATVQFYQNPTSYPDYTNTLTAQTPSITCTPKGTSLRGGQLHLSGEWGTLSQFNYIRIQRDGRTVWGWVDNMIERTATSVVVEYTTDPLRTWRSNLTLGKQYIVRQPQETELFDELLASDTQSSVQEVHEQSYGSDTRILVVQVRRLTVDDHVANTPVQPTPYMFYFVEYNPANWTGGVNDNNPVRQLMDTLQSGAQTENIVTIYSLPYMAIDNLITESLPVRRVGESDPVLIPGFKRLSYQVARPYLRRSMAVALPFNKFEIMQINHDVKVLIPGAGILQVTDEMIAKGNVRVLQDVDLFSGGSNYMLTCGSDNDLTGQSIRGSSVSSIPILSDPYDTYISQNQNALTTSMIGDVANLGVGASMAMTGNPLGAGQVMSGVRGLHNRQTQLADMKNTIPSNPPSFLGTALANYYNNKYYTIITYDDIVNRQDVHQNFGYPINMIKDFVLPDSGFIQTQNCAVRTDGSVPKWAVDEINTLFDNGIRFR